MVVGEITVREATPNGSPMPPPDMVRLHGGGGPLPARSVTSATVIVMSPPEVIPTAARGQESRNPVAESAVTRSGWTDRTPCPLPLRV